MAKMILVTKITEHPESPVWMDFYSCPSSSNPDKSYVVSKSRRGTWGCSCPRWIFKREACKHIRAVQAAIEANILDHASVHDVSFTERAGLTRHLKALLRAGLVETENLPAELPGTAKPDEVTRANFFDL